MYQFQIRSNLFTNLYISFFNICQVFQIKVFGRPYLTLLQFLMILTQFEIICFLQKQTLLRIHGKRSFTNFMVKWAFSVVFLTQLSLIKDINIRHTTFPVWAGISLRVNCEAKQFWLKISFKHDFSLLSFIQVIAKQQILIFTINTTLIKHALQAKRLEIKNFWGLYPMSHNGGLTVLFRPHN